MDELVRWLGEQLAEEAEEAQRNADAFGAVWTVNDAMESVESDTGADVIAEPYAPRSFIAAHDPARVLREINAKRELLRLAAAAHDYHETFTSGFASALERTLRLFALAYKDRSGYKAEEWAP
ncbi:DUF6221 family protein [Streptomyces sp. NPDC001177]